MNEQIDRSKSVRAIAVALGVSITLSIPVAASAAPVVDGRFDPTEGYTDGWSLDFKVERVDEKVGGGELWVHQDPASGDVTVSFTQPVSLVDNSYGRNAIGWGKDTAPSGKNHNFEDLVGSDKARFVFTDGRGEAVLDLTMDYISERPGGGYASLGASGRDGEVAMGSASSLLAWGTSLDYNFNTLGFELTDDSPATDEDYTPNPQYAGWLFEVTYELRVAGDVFGQAGFGGVDIPIVHDSPNKIGKNKVYPEPGGEVPEPASLSILALGVVALLGRRRVRRYRLRP